LKHFSLVKEEIGEDRTVTLTYLASWLIRQTFKEIETILDSIKLDLHEESQFHKNLKRPKNKEGFMIVSRNPETRFVEPVSNGFWNEYKNKKSNSQ
jgi:hypothetical protein